MTRRWLHVARMLLAFNVLVVPSVADAATITYQFSTTVAFIDSTAFGFPASLSGLAVDDTVTATFSFDDAAPAGSSPISGSPFSNATYYALSGATFSANVDGVPFSLWAGIISAFVWNDDSSSGMDGVLFDNIAGPNTPHFQFGNQGLPLTTFTNESLPSTSSLGPLILEMGMFPSSQPFELWFRTARFTMTEVSTAPVPEPATLLLLGGGLGAIAARRRRRRS